MIYLTCARQESPVTRKNNLGTKGNFFCLKKIILCPFPFRLYFDVFVCFSFLGIYLF